MSRHPLRPIAIAVAVIALSSCGGGGDSTSPKPVAQVTISPTSSSVVMGSTIQFTATVLDANDVTLTDRVVSWSSSNTSIATISSTGLAVSVAIGSTSITATAGGVSGTTSLQVTPVPVATVTISPASPNVNVGQSTQLSTVLKDAGGNTLTGRVVTWASSSSAIATVATDGMLTGVAAGSATITATSEGVSGTAVATVVSPVINYEGYKKGSATAMPATLTLPNGVGGSGTLNIDFQDYTVNPVASGSNIVCLVGTAGSGLSTCASLSNPFVMLICGPSGGVGTPVVLKYVLFNTNDAGRVGNSSANLLAALQTGVDYLGIGVYTGCSGTFSTAWIRNYPQTNYYLWPDVFSTYSSAYVSGLLAGMPIFSTPSPGNDWYKYVVVRSSASVFEVWH
jgi:hypothetical protein